MIMDDRKTPMNQRLENTLVEKSAVHRGANMGETSMSDDAWSTSLHTYNIPEAVGHKSLLVAKMLALLTYN